MLAVLKESLQSSSPANGSVSAPILAASGSQPQSNKDNDTLLQSLPGAEAPTRPKRRRAVAKAALQLGAEHQSDAMAAPPQLNGSSRSERVLETGASSVQTALTGSQKPAISPFHGPMKPLRPADKQDVLAPLLNGAYSQLEAAAEQQQQASDIPEALPGMLDMQAQALQERASAADKAGAAVVQEASEQAACTEALSIALSGKPPLNTQSPRL